MAKKKTPTDKAVASPRSARSTKRETSRASAASAATGKTARRKTSRHVNSWLQLSSRAREELFDSTAPAKILDAIESSYTGDVVNALLDLRKAAAKDLLERLSGTRKRAVSEVVTLYFYKNYLMDPFPMSVGNDRTPNYYAILGIPREADTDDIRTAHRLLSKAYSPDGFAPAQRKLAQERLEEISEAYHHLQPERRGDTDRQLPSMHYLYPRRDQSWLESAQKVLEFRS